MKMPWCLSLVLVLLGCSSDDSGPPATVSGAATIYWSLPTTYVDLSPLDPSKLTAIIVYRNDPVQQLQVLSGRSTTVVISNLSIGQHCFFVTAVVGSAESDGSGVVCKRVL